MVSEGHRANDAEMQVDQHLQDVFVELQSTVKGIRELVQQFKMVFPEDMPAGLLHSAPMTTLVLTALMTLATQA